MREKWKSQESSECVRNTFKKSDVWELGGESTYEDGRLTAEEIDMQEQGNHQANKAGCIRGASFVPPTKCERTEL